MKISRKKIRGFKRKIKQLDKWKNYILSYPFETISNSGEIFRIHLPPFVWNNDKSPSHKFLPHLYQTYAEILNNLKNNKSILSKQLNIQIWIFHPRTVRSLIIVGTENYINQRVSMIKAKTTQATPPSIMDKYFSNYRLKLGNDNVLFSNNPESDNPEWQTTKLGNVWVIE